MVPDYRNESKTKTKARACTGLYWQKVIGMRVVLYAEDFEPITVLELPPVARHYLEFHGRVRLAVMEEPKLSSVYEAPVKNYIHEVDIWAERLVMRGKTHLMLFTHDEVQALQLKAAFLPGQRSRLAEAESKAFARGFLHALTRLGS